MSIFILIIGCVMIALWAWYYERIMTWVFNRFPNHFSPQNDHGTLSATRVAEKVVDRSTKSISRIEVRPSDTLSGKTQTAVPHATE